MNNQKRIYRFAPSPTGKMHIGNCRTALLNFFEATKNNGEFFLRIDDTDLNRDKEDYEQCIYDDLKWLGVEYTQIIKQSERNHIYEEYFQKLLALGRVYECFEEEEELVDNAIYDRRALYLSEEDRVELRKTRKPYWRFFLKNNTYQIKDGILGKMNLARNWSDPIIKRPRTEKAFTYNFTSAIDDLVMGVTDIIRAQEHFYNSTIQQEIISALSGHVVNFAHLPLIINSDGHKLSKREGALSICTLREEGYHPLSIISLCLSLGSSQPPVISYHREDYMNKLDLKYFSKNSPQFAKKELTDINRKILRILSDDEIKALGFDLEIWEVIKNNITYLREYVDWEKILNHQELFAPYNDQEKLQRLFNNGEFHLSDMSLEEKKEFFSKLRYALTGLSSGPELDKILRYKMKISNVAKLLQVI